MNKPVVRLTRDSELRDAVREADAPKLAEALWEIVTESLDGIDKVENGKVGLKGKVARETAEMVIRVVGDYVCPSFRSSLANYRY